MGYWMLRRAESEEYFQFMLEWTVVEGEKCQYKLKWNMNEKGVGGGGGISMFHCVFSPLCLTLNLTLVLSPLCLTLTLTQP